MTKAVAMRPASSSSRCRFRSPKKIAAELQIVTVTTSCASGPRSTRRCPSASRLSVLRQWCKAAVRDRGPPARPDEDRESGEQRARWQVQLENVERRRAALNGQDDRQEQKNAHPAGEVAEREREREPAPG